MTYGSVQVLDLSVIANEGLFAGFDAACFNEVRPTVTECREALFNLVFLYGVTQSALNSFMAQGSHAWATARATIQHLLAAGEPTLRDNEPLKSKALIPLHNVRPEVVYSRVLVGTHEPSGSHWPINALSR